MDCSSRWSGETDPTHGLGKLLPILRQANGALTGSDQLDSVLLQRPIPFQRDGDVQGRLSTHCREQGVGALPLDHLRYPLGGDRLDVATISQLRVGHDRGWLRVDRDAAVS